MPNFSEDSKAKLATCHPYLRKLFEEVIKTYDCSVLCGERNQADQDKAVAAGESKTPWPTSKHNSSPSMAVDAAPYPIIWPDKENRPDTYTKDVGRFYYFAGYVKAIADKMNIQIRYGGDWNLNKIFTDQSFDDLDHFELISEAIKDNIQ